MQHSLHNQDSQKHRGRSQKINWARIHILSLRLVGDNPIAFFISNRETALSGWVSLLSLTTLPTGIKSSDVLILDAFKALDKVVCGGQEDYMLRRLAYVQLMKLFDHIEDIIRSERQSRLLHRASGCGDKSIAIDIYMKAQKHSNPEETRHQLLERRRMGRRWAPLAGPSPLCLLIYSGEAEAVVCVEYPFRAP
jgi:hypothetical protein